MASGVSRAGWAVCTSWSKKDEWDTARRKWLDAKHNPNGDNDNQHLKNEMRKLERIYKNRKNTVRKMAGARTWKNEASA